MWQSQVQLGALVQDVEFSRKIGAAYVRALFWRSSVFPPGYTADPGWTSVVRLSPEAEALPEVVELKAKFPEADFMLAAFRTFAHHDVLIDLDALDLEGIDRIFHQELLSEKLRVPFGHGSLLYHRFNDTHHSSRTDHLPTEETQQLLGGTPQGVCQIGELVSGPLGLLHSQTHRWSPPSKYLPLWHCSDTGCRVLHGVRLRSADTPFTEAARSLGRALLDGHGRASEWNATLAQVVLNEERISRLAFVDVIPFMADCILAADRAALLTAAFQTPDGAKLRTEYGKDPRRPSDLQRSADKIVGSLSPEEQLQLLACLPDASLTRLVDRLVADKTIKLGLGESRQASWSIRPHPGSAICELSARGIRSCNLDPLNFLVSGVSQAYTGGSAVSELEWRTKTSGTSPSSCIASYVREHGAAKAVSDLVLSSGDITERVCGTLSLDLDLTKDVEAVNRMLWKFGFEPSEYDDELSVLQRRIKTFDEAVMSAGSIETESEREQVRAAGVNLFVSAEIFLEKLLVYNIWLLASDHFVETNFRYELGNARTKVSSTLGAELQMGSDPVRWSNAGENTLGVLLRYLSAATDWMQECSQADRDRVRRLLADMPHYSQDRVPFGFKHRALWADARPSDLGKFAATFSATAKLLHEAKLAECRNGLDHYRDPSRFPTSDDMLACAARLRRAAEQAELHRHFPHVHWVTQRTTDASNITAYDLVDYSGRRLVIYRPTFVAGLPTPALGVPYLVAPGNLLGEPHSDLCFTYLEETSYSRHWSNYPRRRQIPPPGALEDT